VQFDHIFGGAIIMQAKRPHTIVSCLIHKGEKILLVQEGKESYYGKWNIPSGRLENNEDIIVAAIREVMEETGCEVRIKGLSGIYTYLSSLDHHIINYNFWGEMINENIKFDGEEILNVKWFTFDELRKMENKQFRDFQYIRMVIENATQESLYPMNIIKNLI
jgi:8-oxo-dGTP diphosphatase